jgi:predicted patatin/cPLA2 family phospholipase
MSSTEGPEFMIEPSRASIGLRELLERRASANSRADGQTVGIVIEGGAMRGVVAGGMIAALDSLGYSQCFDLAAGTSAGAIACAYLIGGCARLGPRIYYEHLTDRRWLDATRIMSQRSSILDFNYLFDRVILDRKRLDLDAVVASGTQLLVTATRRSDWQGVVLTPDTPEDVLLALKASSRIPVLGGAPVLMGGIEYVDGSITSSIPLNLLNERGASHVLVFRTDPAGHKARSVFGLRRYGHRVVDRFAPGLGAMQAGRDARYRAEVEAVDKLELPESMVVAPSADERTVGLLEQNPKRLYLGAASGARAVFRAFGQSASEADIEALLMRPRGT